MSLALLTTRAKRVKSCPLADTPGGCEKIFEVSLARHSDTAAGPREVQVGSCGVSLQVLSTKPGHPETQAIVNRPFSFPKKLGG